METRVEDDLDVRFEMELHNSNFRCNTLGNPFTFMMYFVATVVALVVGCAQPKDDLADTISELENVANCFHASTTLLQNQPESPEKFPQFLFEGLKGSKSSENIPAHANFSALLWSDDRNSVETLSGKTIQCRIVDQQHDNYSDGRTAFLTTYEFFIPSTEYSAKTTIEISMGD